MEKRFVVFLALSLGILVGYNLLLRWLLPPRPVAAQPEQLDEANAGPEDELNGEPPAGQAESPGDNVPAAEIPSPSIASVDEPPAAGIPRQWASLGSFAADSEYSLLIFFSNRGAAIERVELTARDEDGNLRYAQLDDRGGYLGYLALTPREGGGCVVNVVGAGTPAATAGLQVGDVITHVADAALDLPRQLTDALRNRKPGETINLTVLRGAAGDSRTIDVTATLDVRPLALLQQEALQPGEIQPHPPSFLMSLVERSGDSAIGRHPSDIKNWTIRQVESDMIEFALRTSDPSSAGNDRPLDLVKRYRLGAVGDDNGSEMPAAAARFGVRMELDIHNPTTEPRRLQFRLMGPNGLPIEGWWYSSKIHPRMFYGAGARDVLCKTAGEGWRMLGTPELYKQAKKDDRDPAITLFAEGDSVPDRTLKFLAVDTQYFLAALQPAEPEDPREALFQRAEAFALGDVALQPKGLSRTTNVGFELWSEPFQLPPEAGRSFDFTLFLGPKDPSVLAAYGLSDSLYYGWFGGISRILANILHFFYGLVGNYGIAIVMLTVLVRACMFPISRKAAKNAAMMQELAPEMKKIAEKYKSDMEKRAKAQQDLFKRHNYNPFGGCWLMFLQLPIFLGLYRALAVDIDLRQAALIPGIQWASNLAGPDQLWYWKPFLPSFLGSETGMLGPYLNVLPLITVGLFLVHQQLFTPPATDEQSRMQLQMMKYMTVFMGFLFFKVASGLCLYFIASSLWGIAERKLVPKPKVTLGKDEPAPKESLWKRKPAEESNGSKPTARRKRNKRR